MRKLEKGQFAGQTELSKWLYFSCADQHDFDSTKYTDNLTTYDLVIIEPDDVFLYLQPGDMDEEEAAFLKQQAGVIFTTDHLSRVTAEWYTDREELFAAWSKKATAPDNESEIS